MQLTQNELSKCTLFVAQNVYSELLAGPRHLQPPKPAGPAGSRNPEGLVYLAKSIAHMNENYVQYVHRANHDLQQRFLQLCDEVRQHAASAGELTELAGRVAARQKQLAARLAPLQAMQQVRLARVNFQLQHTT